MNIRLPICRRFRQKQGGFAVVVILILLCIMLLFVMANTVTTNWLRKQVKIVEQQQNLRWTQAATNQHVSR